MDQNTAVGIVVFAAGLAALWYFATRQPRNGRAVVMPAPMPPDPPRLLSPYDHSDNIAYDLARHYVDDRRRQREVRRTIQDFVGASQDLSSMARALGVQFEDVPTAPK